MIWHNDDVIMTVFQSEEPNIPPVLNKVEVKGAFYVWVKILIRIKNEREKIVFATTFVSLRLKELNNRRGLKMLILFFTHVMYSGCTKVQYMWIQQKPVNPLTNRRKINFCKNFLRTLKFVNLF